jgi:hypothetical protein
MLYDAIPPMKEAREYDELYCTSRDDDQLIVELAKR